MGTSLTVPIQTQPGKVEHKQSGSIVTIEQSSNGMIHTLAERELTASYQIAYQVGGGLMGRTFLTRNSDYLSESPVSWFNSYGWDVSPGYAGTTLLDFDRVMDRQCLFCHAGSAEFADVDGRRLRNIAQLGAISCDRCHGASDAHVRHPSKINIINPASLTGRARDSVCEQCHLEGATRILNPGRSWSDYHAGARAEATFATYVAQGGPGQDVIAVSQVEQLAQSKCLLGSKGKVWCGTCHQPHAEPVVDRKAQRRSICLRCHANLSADAHPQTATDCVACHMPRRQTTDISHAALTDHRILRRPSPQATDAQPLQVKAWSDPPIAAQARDLALARIIVGFSKRSQELTESGFGALQALPQEALDRDAEALSDLEGLAMQEQRFSDAIRFGLEIVRLQPTSAKAALNLGIVYKGAGEAAEAEYQLNRAIELDPALRQAYIELATLCVSEQKADEARAIVDRYLKFRPQDIMFRLQRERMN